MAQKLFEKNPSKLENWEIGIVSNLDTSGGDTSSDEADAHADRISQFSESHVTNSSTLVRRKSHGAHLVEDINTNKVENEQSYECQLCSKSVKSLNELDIHDFVEHNSKSRVIVPAAYTSESHKILMREKHNTDVTEAHGYLAQR